MLTFILWLLTGVIAAGIGLAVLWLLEHRFREAAQFGAVAHGAAGAAGTVLALRLILAGAPDPGGLGRVAAVLLAGALLGGAVLALAQLRRRRAPGLVVTIHATLGVAGFVILLAYASVPR
jgi:hypothetical protein